MSCTNRTGPAAQCSQYLLAHHLAKVLAYTGEPDVIARILAIVPKGDEDQPGQIDLMYSLRLLETGWTSAQKQQVIDWFGKASKWRGGSTFAGHVNNIFDATIDAFSEDEKQLAYKAGAAVRADHRGQRGGGGDAERRPRRRGRAGGRGRGAERAARSPGALRQPGVPARRRSGIARRAAAARPIATEGERVFRDTCAQCHRFGTLGKDYAPDLTKVADRLAAARHPALDLLPAREGRSEVRDHGDCDQGRQDHPRAGRERDWART